MIRGGTPGAIVRLGAPSPPPAPHPLAVEASRPGPLSRAGMGGFSGLGDLNSRRRRFAADLQWAATRHERLLALLRDRAGLDGGASEAALRQGSWLGLLVLHGGLPPRDAAAAWGDRDFVDWDVFADPAHALTGWVLEAGPSAVVALGVACSLPDAFARRLLSDHAGGAGAGRVVDEDREALAILGDLAEPVLLARALNQRAPLTLRANRLKATRDEVLAALRVEGIDARPSRWTDDGVIVIDRPNVQSSPTVRAGLAEVQDEGSALLVDLLAPRPGDVVVDACAGAGGKALAIASRMGGDGTVLAADVRSSALQELGRRAQRAGASISALTVGATGALPKRLRKLAGKADCVLVDVPCSSSGALRRRPKARWAVTDGEIARLAGLQGEILRRFAPLVRPGGVLVYATCSVFAEENEDVVRAFTSSPDGAEFERVPASDRLSRRVADSAVSGGVLRLLPHRHGTDGFFGIALQRLPADPTVEP